MSEKKQTDIQEVARLAGCSPARVRALIKAGKIPAETKGRQREITIPLQDAVKIVKEGQRAYRKKSRIVWHSSSDEMPKAGSFILLYGDKTWHLMKYSAAADDEYVKRFDFWVYLTPEMLPMKGVSE